MQLILLLSTFPDEAVAATIIRKLVEERLVVCGTIISRAKSIYSWQGKIEESDEVVVFLKSRVALQSACMKRLRALHPYEVPEIIAVRPEAVDQDYTAWVENYVALSE